MTIKELREKAKSMGLSGYSKMRKIYRREYITY